MSNTRLSHCVVPSGLVTNTVTSVAESQLSLTITIPSNEYIQLPSFVFSVVMPLNIPFPHPTISGASVSFTVTVKLQLTEFTPSVNVYVIVLTPWLKIVEGT